MFAYCHRCSTAWVCVALSDRLDLSLIASHYNVNPL